MCSNCDGRHVSVVIPTLNEGLTVSRVIAEVRSVLPLAEVIVVDGGSIDGTREAAWRAGAKVLVCRRRGYGEAIRMGARSASRELVVMVDGDATYDLSNLKRLVAEASAGRVVVGCRFHSKPEGMDLLGFFGNWVISKIFRLVWGVKVADTQSGLKVFPKWMASAFRCGDMAFSSEVLVRAKQLGVPIVEVGIGEYRRRVEGSKSKLRRIPDGLSILRFIIGERLLGRKVGGNEARLCC